MQTFQAVIVVFLAFFIGANCADFKNSIASENGPESATANFYCAANPCKYGGTCINEGDTYTCVCPEDFVGKNCSENRVCERHGKELCGRGKCYFDMDKLDYNCTCEEGDFYTILKGCIVDHCASNPCKNGGTCRMSSDGTYSCFCSGFYIGKNCTENEWCRFYGWMDCGEATCHYNTVSKKVTCSCPPNEEFDRNLKICKGACKPDPCVHGTCVKKGYRDFSCKCFDSYTGKLCNEKVIGSCTPNPCQNGGTCLEFGSTFMCICKTLYSGNTCEHGNRVMIPSLLASLGTVVLLSILCGLFWYKRKQNLKRMSPPVSYHVPQPAATLENGKSNIYPTVPRY